MIIKIIIYDISYNIPQQYVITKRSSQSTKVIIHIKSSETLTPQGKERRDRKETFRSQIMTQPRKQEEQKHQSSSPIIILDKYLIIREGLNGKKTSSFGHCPNHLTPPPLTPFRATWSFFWEVKIQDLKISLELKILYVLYDILYICNLKTVKVQYIGIFEEIDSFY